MERQYIYLRILHLVVMKETSYTLQKCYSLKRSWQVSPYIWEKVGPWLCTDGGVWVLYGKFHGVLRGEKDYYLPVNELWRQACHKLSKCFFSTFIQGKNDIETAGGQHESTFNLFLDVLPRETNLFPEITVLTCEFLLVKIQ